MTAADEMGGGDDVGRITVDELKQKKNGFCGAICQAKTERSPKFPSQSMAGRQARMRSTKTHGLLMRKPVPPC